MVHALLPVFVNAHQTLSTGYSTLSRSPVELGG